MASSRFPKKDIDFYNYANAAVPYLIANASRLQIYSAKITALTALNADWKNNWTLYQSPQTKTVVVTHTKTELRNKLEKMLIEIFGDIPRSVINSTDELELRVKGKRNVRTKAHVMNHPPEMDLKVEGLKRFTLRFHDPERKETKALPGSQVFVVILVFIGPADLPPGDVLWQQIHFSPTALFFLDLSNEASGKTVYLQWYYVNTRGKKSPSSPTMTFVLG